MLQGFGGIGKTVLAAQIATDWLKENGGRVLWLPFGSASEDAAFEALAQPFNMSKEMASAEGKGKSRLLNELLQAADVRLLVLDDVWNGASLYAILNELSKKISVLVTGRQRYALKKIIPVPELSPAAALKLLRELAEDFSKDKKESAGLCADLGHLAFAIVIAGRTMQAKSYTAKQLREEITRIGKTDLEVPQEFREAGRETVAALIETSLEAMPYNAKMAFQVWGAFWSAQITPELMMRYFEGNDPSSFENVLNLLHQYGFAGFNPATAYPDGRLRTVATYRLYDLAFSYSEKGASQEMRQKALAACLAYTNAHNKPSLENFAALLPEMENFLGASLFAMQNKFYSEVEGFALDLYMGSRVLNFQSLYNLAINFLGQATIAAKSVNNRNNQAAHLGNLGEAHRLLRQYQQAVEIYEQALIIVDAIDDRLTKAAILGNMGNIYLDLKDNVQALNYYQEAFTIANAMGDMPNVGIWLCNLGIAHKNLGQVAEAINCYEKALTIHQNLDDKFATGNVFGNLGNLYDYLGEHERAVTYYENALNLSRQIGDKLGESNRLNNLGVTYNNRGNYIKAISYYEQALIVQESLGVPYRIETTEYNLARARQLLAEQQQGGKQDA